MRWNAVAMVVQANKASSEYGGHLASYASSATLYEVGFNHFWRGASDKHPGDMVFMQGHSSPGIYARAFLEGRLSEEQLKHFRQEVGGGGLSSYPHPWLMPDFWQFPTVSMGLGPMMAIYQARFLRYMENRGIVAAVGPQGLVLLRRRRDGRARVDGRAHDAGAREARQSRVRHQLQPAASRRAGARQRQDHPGTRSRLPRRRLERHQGAVGLALGSAAREGSQAASCGAAMEDCVDGEYQNFKAKGGAYTREHFFGKHPELTAMVAQHVGRGHLAPESRRPRCAEGVCGLRLGHAHKGQPTVILAKTVKGFGLGKAAEGQKVTHQQKKMDAESLASFRDEPAASSSATRTSRASRSASLRKTARRSST